MRRAPVSQCPLLPDYPNSVPRGESSNKRATGAAAYWLIGAMLSLDDGLSVTPRAPRKEPILSPLTQLRQQTHRQ